jgi:hypothetical protein
MPYRTIGWIWLRRAYLAWSTLVPFIALAIALIAVLRNGETVQRVDTTVQDIRRESVERRDQQCLVFERLAVQGVNTFHESQAQLANTLTYLAHLSSADRKSALNRAVKANVPQLRNSVIQRWEEAKAAKAPPYCDKPNVGLPEPNPRLPPEPRFSP